MRRVGLIVNDHNWRGVEIRQLEVMEAYNADIVYIHCMYGYMATAMGVLEMTQRLSMKHHPEPEYESLVGEFCDGDLGTWLGRRNFGQEQGESVFAALEILPLETLGVQDVQWWRRFQGR